MNLIKVGNTLVNLDHVTDVLLSEQRVILRFDVVTTDGSGQYDVVFHGDETAAVRRYLCGGASFDVLAWHRHCLESEALEAAGSAEVERMIPPVEVAF